MENGSRERRLPSKAGEIFISTWSNSYDMLKMQNVVFMLHTGVAGRKAKTSSCGQSAVNEAYCLLLSIRCLQVHF